jgi:uncharacterized protein involved in exopolysaccharide biosynthesis
MSERATPAPLPTPRLEVEPGLLDYARRLGGRWPLIVGATVAGALVGLLVSWFTPKMYEASVTIAVRPITGDQLPPTAIAAVRKLFENRSAAASVVKELGLDRAPHHLTAERFVKSHLTTEQVRGSDLLQTYVRLTTPDLAARAANRIVQEVAALNRRLSQKETASADEFLGLEVQKARERAERLNQEILAYKRKAQIDLARQDAERALSRRDRLAELTVEIESEKAALKRAEEELAKENPAAREARGTDALAYQIASARMRLSAREREQQELTRSRASSDSQQAQLNALYDKEAGLKRLESERDLALKFYGDLSTRYEQARIQAASKALQLDIVDSAVPPERASQPRTASNVAVGAAVGFLGSTFWLLAISAAPTFRNAVGGPP